MYRACKVFRFSAAHKLVQSYTEACREIHGHNYKVEVVMECSELNRDGMVIDFGKLKAFMAPIIAELDHSLILMDGDGAPGNGKIFMPDNPTAENMAKLLYRKLGSEYLNLEDREKTDSGYIRNITINKIRVWETDDCYAEYIG